MALPAAVRRRPACFSAGIVAACVIVALMTSSLPRVAVGAVDADLLGEKALASQPSVVDFVATPTGSAFISSCSREEFSVIDTDSVVAGAGTEEMLPPAVLNMGNSGSKLVAGLKAFRNINLRESQSRDYLRTIFVREPAGTILDFVMSESGQGSVCPARNYGIRARLTDFLTENGYVTLYYQQYDAGSHVFIDEVGVVTVPQTSFLRTTSSTHGVEAGDMVTFMCKDFGSPVLVYLGWPNSLPVYKMDSNWSLPFRVVHMTTIRTPSHKSHAVVTVLEPLDPSVSSDLILDPNTQKPMEGSFMFVGKANDVNKMYAAIASNLEGKICHLNAFRGERRPGLECFLEDGEFNTGRLKSIGKARKAKIATSILSSALGALAVLMALKGGNARKAALLPFSLAVGSAGGAIASKVIESKGVDGLLERVKPSFDLDYEHIVFVRADNLTPPTPEQDAKRKVELMLDLAEVQRKEEEEKQLLEDRKNARMQMFDERLEARRQELAEKIAAREADEAKRERGQ